jgi:small subunit ribosomal protein S6
LIRTYELGLVIDPRTSDDEAVELVENFKTMLTAGGARITKEESWGKRRLAYTIQKLNEGRYFFLYLELDEGGKNPLPEVELRLRQNDKILRYLTVRTDQDLKRAASHGGKRSTDDVSTVDPMAADDNGADEGWEKD